MSAPFAAVSTPAFSVPAPATPLLGRDAEMAQALYLLEEQGVRLLTLHGPAGVGKTRLALQLATVVRARYDDGVVLVPLTTSDPHQAIVAIAHAVGLQDSGDRPVQERLAAHLRSRPLLLVLDAVEQVIALGPRVADLVAVSPRLTVVVTSRTVLGVAGERTLALPPLAVPAVGTRPAVEELMAYGAIQLFVDRARAAAPDFALTPANAATVVALCRRLDGLPLALELAAAWSGVLSPQALLMGLEHHLSGLPPVGTDPRAERPRSLRGALAWSYERLSPLDQVVFRRLAVFAGSWTREAAQAVCGDAALSAAAGRPVVDADAVAGALATLQASSLLWGEDAPSAAEESAPLGHRVPRLGLLQTMRAYARERLVESGETHAVGQAHAAYYLALVGGPHHRLAGSEESAWLARVEAEHENLRAALQWACAQQESALALALAAALAHFWNTRGYVAEGRRWLDEALALPPAQPPSAAWQALRAPALHGAGVLAFTAGAYTQATALLQQSAALYRDLDDPARAAEILTDLGTVARDQGDYARATALHEESLALHRAIGARRGEAAALRFLSLLAREQGAYARATSLCQESIALSRALEDPRNLAWALLTRADIARDQGDAAQVVALCRESLALFRAQGAALGCGFALHNLGVAAAAQGEHERADAVCRESLALFRELGAIGGVAEVLVSLGRLAHERGEFEQAESLCRESLALAQAEAPRWLSAGALEGLAAVAASRGAVSVAVPFLAAAGAVRQALGTPLPPARQASLEQIRAAILSATAAQEAAPQTLFGATWASVSALLPGAAPQEPQERAVSDAPGRLAVAAPQGTASSVPDVFQASTTALLLVQRHTWVVQEINAAACGLLGYTRAEVVGRPCTAFLHADDRPRLAALLAPVEQHPTAATQVLLVRRDGTPVPAEIQVAPVQYQGGVYDLVTVHDVAARLQVEERLWEQEAAYHGVFEATSDGLIIATLEGAVVAANPAVCAMHGYTSAAFMALSPAALLPPQEQEHHHAGMAAVRRGAALTVQSTHVRQDDTAFEAEVRYTPLLYRGRPHALLVVHDITERVHAYRLLEQRVAERTRELSTLLEVAQHVASTLEVQPLLELILDQLQVVAAYTGAALTTFEGAEAVMIATRGPESDAYLRRQRFPLERGAVLWEAIRAGETVIIADVRAATPWAVAYRAVVGDLRTTTVADVRSWLAVPLILKERVIGLLSLSHEQPAYFTAHHAHMARAIATQAAVAIENARLYEQARQVAVLEERQRLARELHDSVSQALYGIALGAKTARTLLDREPGQVAQPLEYVLSLAEAGLAEMRALIFALLPTALETEGVVAALQRQAAAVQARHGLQLEVTVCREPEVPLAVKEALYRIAQEALHNSVKHAHARTARIRLAVEAGALTLEVSDDGIGFDPQAAFPGHLGQSTMRERAAQVGGTLVVVSAPGQGTQVRVRIPTAPERDAQQRAAGADTIIPVEDDAE